MRKGKILVTGGCGYIGSHTVVDLLQNGFEVISIDSLINGSESVLVGIHEITGREVVNIKCDLSTDHSIEILRQHASDVDGVIHFAALKSVGESVEKSLLYYKNNIKSLINILQLVEEMKIKAFVFSSSCTVYGETKILPVHENLDFMPTNSPYGRTKQMSEQIIADFYLKTSKESKAVSLRYFNPAGAHNSYKIGESPINPPLNLVPIITETAYGLREKISIHGNDYPTRDGTCIRDYIHVMDLANAHTLALKHMLTGQQTNQLEAYNLGIGEGVSVLEAIYAFEESTGIKLPYNIGPRREGDLAAMYADSTKVKTVLGWEPKYSISDIMRDAWEWEKVRRKLYK
ncbi:MAG: UDP-glucose 4-epimerase GalE [Saprospiraceae bacterium]|nr:UDP-glucose 4-epimerase GalE [Saprospiraceae bacterium]